MNYRFTFAVLISLFSVAANCQPEMRNRGAYSLLCVDEDATGYNWVNKKWVRTSFKSEKYVVTRIEPTKYSSTAVARTNNLFLCEDKSKDDLNLSNMTALYACYSISSLGEKPGPMDARMCSEIWEKGNLTQVHCNEHSGQFSFEPNGNFIRKPWHSDARSSETKKDSLVLSVGKCSTIN